MRTLASTHSVLYAILLLDSPGIFAAGYTVFCTM